MSIADNFQKNHCAIFRSRSQGSRSGRKKNINMKNWRSKRSTKKYYYCVFSESHSQPWMCIPIAQLASPQVITASQVEKEDQLSGAPSALPSLPPARPILPAGVFYNVKNGSSSITSKSSSENLSNQNKPAKPAKPAGSLTNAGTKSISGSSRYTPEILAEIIA